MTTTIVKWGNSRGVRLPKPFLEGLNLKDNDAVDITTDNNTITGLLRRRLLAMTSLWQYRDRSSKLTTVQTLTQSKKTGQI